jgi:hypothetical protein
VTTRKTPSKTPKSGGKAEAQPPAAAGTPPAPLDADFAGTCSLEIYDSPSPPPPGDHPLRCRIEFSADRRTVALREFQPIRTGEYAAKVGPLSVTNATAVHLKSSRHGTLTRDGHVEIDVVLFFDHAFDAPWVEEDSDLHITLSTRDGGQPLDARGSVTLAGTGRFSGGALDGCRCRLVYRGRVNPLPW